MLFPETIGSSQSTVLGRLGLLDFAVVQARAAAADQLDNQQPSPDNADLQSFEDPQDSSCIQGANSHREVEPHR